MSDLSEFLLARIAEDEAVAKAARPVEDEWGNREYDRDSWHEAHCGYLMGEFLHDCECKVPDRVLAECDARRRIVENGRGYRDGESGFGASQYAMQCLALAYTDHPDYRRDEWRP